MKAGIFLHPARQGLITTLAAVAIAIPAYSAPKTVMGVPPETLLATLPPAPKKWKLVSSVGMNEISALPALLTFAIREYREEPPRSDPAAPPPLPRITKITLLDTAFDRDRAFVFDVFKQPASETVKHSTVQGLRLVERTAGDNKRIIAAEIDSRFILTMELQNQDDASRDAWIEAINLPNLRTWAAQAPRLAPTPRAFKVSSVDELNPKSNQTLSIPYGRDER
jgi:hypothetical protein